MADTSNPLIAALRPLTSRVRTDVTAAKEVGEKHSTWRRVPLTDERLAQHLNGGPARGVCPIKAGESVTMVALLDFDSHGGETGWGEMAATAAGVADTLALAWGAPVVAFRSSGGRGVHLYLLWDEPQDAYSVREWLRGVLQACGLKSGTRGVVNGEVEIFPKQDEVPLGGFGNQFILPLAGASEPLEYDDLADTLVPRSGGKAGAVDLMWPTAGPVPVRERPVRAVAPVGRAADVGAGRPWRSALDALGNGLDGSAELGYDEWRNVIFAIHHETGGSDEGLALAHEWSARATKYDAAFLDERVWPYVKTGSERGAGGGAAVTGGTIMSLASRAGWNEPLDAGAFPVVEVPRQEPPRAANGGPMPGAHEEDDELPNFDREKTGVIKATVANAVMAMRRPDLVGLRIGHDEFRDEITVARRGTDEWVPMTDADLVRLRIAMEQMGFKTAPKELARDAVVLVAAERRYDSAQLWLKGLVWDGVPRVEQFLARYMGTTDSAYTRAVSRYMWTALAGRVLQPGVKADMVPIYEGDQGLRKSSAIEAISPAPDFFVEIDLEEPEENTVRKMRGALAVVVRAQRRRLRLHHADPGDVLLLPPQVDGAADLQPPALDRRLLVARLRLPLDRRPSPRLHAAARLDPDARDRLHHVPHRAELGLGGERLLHGRAGLVEGLQQLPDQILPPRDHLLRPPDRAGADAGAPRRLAAHPLHRLGPRPRPHGDDGLGDHDRLRLRLLRDPEDLGDGDLLGEAGERALLARARRAAPLLGDDVDHGDPAGLALEGDGRRREAHAPGLHRDAHRQLSVLARARAGGAHLRRRHAGLRLQRADDHREGEGARGPGRRARRRDGLGDRHGWRDLQEAGGLRPHGDRHHPHRHARDDGPPDVPGGAAREGLPRHEAALGARALRADRKS